MSPKTIASILAILGVIAAAYFAVTSYREMASENAKLSRELASEKATTKELRAQARRITETLNRNTHSTTTIIEKTKETKEALNALPETNSCANSAPIQLVLERLRDGSK